MLCDQVSIALLNVAIDTSQHTPLGLINSSMTYLQANEVNINYPHKKVKLLFEYVNRRFLTKDESYRDET